MKQLTPNELWLRQNISDSIKIARLSKKEVKRVFWGILRDYEKSESDWKRHNKLPKRQGNHQKKQMHKLP